MYIYSLNERFLGQTVVFPGKGFTRLNYDISEEKMEFLYNIGHPAIKRHKKRIKKVTPPVKDDKPEFTD